MDDEIMHTKDQCNGILMRVLHACQNACQHAQVNCGAMHRGLGSNVAE